MSYSTASHSTFYHRSHVVWATKYRYKVLQGAMRDQIPIAIAIAGMWRDADFRQGTRHDPPGRARRAASRR